MSFRPNRELFSLASIFTIHTILHDRQIARIGTTTHQIKDLPSKTPDRKANSHHFGVIGSNHEQMFIKFFLLTFM